MENKNLTEQITELDKSIDHLIIGIWKLLNELYANHTHKIHLNDDYITSRISKVLDELENHPVSKILNILEDNDEI